MKKNFSEALKELRIRAGYSQKEVYEMFNIRQSTFSAWETGRAEPSAEMLLKLCKLYNVSDVFSAFGYDGYNEDGSIQLNLKEIEHIEKYRSLDLYGQETVSYILDRESDRVKKYGKLGEQGTINLIEVSPTTDISKVIPYWKEGAAAGSGIYQLNDTESVPMKLFVTSITRQADFIIKVSGESMSPDYHDGDKVLVSQKAVVQLGEVGIFVKNGSSYIKEMGTMELISRNPDYPNIPVNDFDNVVCLGKVIGKVTDDMIVHD